MPPHLAAARGLRAAAEAADNGHSATRALEVALAAVYGGPQDTTELGMTLPDEDQTDAWFRALDLAMKAAKITGLPVPFPSTSRAAEALRQASIWCDERL